MTTKTIPLQEIHQALGAKMVPFAGFLMPVRYSGDIDEHLAVRQAVGIFDVSHMGEFRVTGKNAKTYLQNITTNDLNKIGPGKAQYSCLPNKEGGIVDDIIVYQLKEEEYLVVVNASNIEKDWSWMQSQLTGGVSMLNESDEWCLFAVQGPKASALLDEALGAGTHDMPYYTIKTLSEDVYVATTGYTGSGGGEVFVRTPKAEELWNTIMEKGLKYGIKPIGLGARDTLRLEMGYCLYGNDIDDLTSPIEAGLGWITSSAKSFVASEYILGQKKNGTARKLVGLLMEGKSIPRSGYEVYDNDGNTVGVVRSGSISPMLQQGIALAYVHTAYAGVGATLLIKIRDQMQAARVVKTPFVSISNV